MTLERLPEELWTSYLKRRLEAEAFKFEEVEPYFLDPGYLIQVETIISPTATIMLQRVIDFGTSERGRAVARATKYSELPAQSEIGTLTELAYLSDRGEGNFMAGLCDDGRVRAGRTTSLQATTGPLSRYKNERYDSSAVIDDIVRYAVEQRNPDRPIAVLEQTDEIESTKEDRERVWQKLVESFSKGRPEQ